LTERVGAGGVAPDVGRSPGAGRLARDLDPPLAMPYARRTGPPDSQVTHVIVDVEGMRPIIIDDMISTAATMRQGIEARIRLGAQPDIRAAATHPAFTPPAEDRRSHPAITGLYGTATVRLRPDVARATVP